MVFSDLIKKKNRLRKNIGDLRNILRKANYKDADKILSEIYNIADEYRNVLVKIDQINRDAVLTIESNSMDLSTAVIIKKSIMSKIDLLSDLIENDNYDVMDRLGYIEKRNREIESLDLLNFHMRSLEMTLEI